MIWFDIEEALLEFEGALYRVFEQGMLGMGMDMDIWECTVLLLLLTRTLLAYRRRMHEF